MENHKQHYWVKHIDGFYICSGCKEIRYPRQFQRTWP